MGWGKTGWDEQAEVQEHDKRVADPGLEPRSSIASPTLFSSPTCLLLQKAHFYCVVFYGEMISIDSQILFSGWSAAFLLVLEKSVITALKLLTHRINI